MIHFQLNANWNRQCSNVRKGLTTLKIIHGLGALSLAAFGNSVPKPLCSVHNLSAKYTACLWNLRNYRAWGTKGTMHEIIGRDRVVMG